MERKTAPYRGLRVAFITPCISCGQYVEPQDEHQHAVTGDMVCTSCAIRGAATVVAACAASLSTAQEALAGGDQ